MKRYIKKLLRESLISEDDDIKQKLISLIKSGDKNNIELAYEVGKGQGINMDEFVKSEYGDLLNASDGDTIKDKLIKLTNLKELNLGWNKLTSLPDSIGNLTNLEKLDLSNNKLTSLPNSIRNLKNLKELNLGYNELESLPDSIGNLTNLESLLLSYCNLTSLPDWIGNLKNLKWLDLMGNKNLKTLPNSIGNLTKMQGLALDSIYISYKEIERIKELLPADSIVDWDDYAYDSDWDAYDYE